MDEREVVVASYLGMTVGWGRSLKWADWVHVNYFVSKWLDSGFEGASRQINRRHILSLDPKQTVGTAGVCN